MSADPENISDGVTNSGAIFFNLYMPAMDMKASRLEMIIKSKLLPVLTAAKPSKMVMII